MIDERQQEFAALYVLDLLEGAEFAKFEAELKEDGKLQQFVRELREASSLIAQRAPQVDSPPELKERVLAAFRESKSNAAESLIFRPAVIIPWTIAAGLAIGCVWLSQLFLQSRAGYSVLQDESALSQIEVSTARNELEAERILSNRQLSDATRELTQLNLQLVQSTGKIVEATRVLGQTYDQLDKARTELLDRDSRLAELAEQLTIATGEISDLRERLRSQNDLPQGQQPNVP